MQNAFVIAEEIIQEVSNQIYYGDMRIAYVNFYYGYNKYCSILRKEAGSANAISSNIRYYWTANPWDYATVDTPCRLLTEIYPY